MLTAPILFGFLISPGFLGPVLVQVRFTCFAERDLGLAAVDSSPRAVTVVIPVPACVLWAIRQAAALAAGVKGIRALVPPAEVLVRIAHSRVLSALDLRRLGCFQRDLAPVSVL